MKRKELTLENFLFEVEDKHQTKQDIVDLIKIGMPVKLNKVQEGFTTDWKNLRHHKQYLEVWDGEVWVKCFRTITSTGELSGRKKIFAMCGSEWD